jgi:hypothetical protein
MKAKEMSATVSALTWDNVTAFIREGAPDGFSNDEISEALKAPYDRVSSLTKLMFEAGALARVQTGKTGGATFYYMPLNQ